MTHKTFDEISHVQTYEMKLQYIHTVYTFQCMTESNNHHPDESNA